MWHDPKATWVQKPQLKNELDLISLWLCMWVTVLIGGWGWRAWPTVGSTIPRQLGLGCRKLLSMHQRVSQEEAFCRGWILPWFLPQLLSATDCGLEVWNEINPFVLELLLVTVIIHRDHQDLTREWMLECFDNCQPHCKVMQLLNRIFMLAGTFMSSSRLVLQF